MVHKARISLTDRQTERQTGIISYLWVSFAVLQWNLNDVVYDLSACRSIGSLQEIMKQCLN